MTRSLCVVHFLTRQSLKCLFHSDSSVTNYFKYDRQEDVLVGRDDHFRELNNLIKWRMLDIICCTSRVMGKTAFMVAVGMQMMKLELKKTVDFGCFGNWMKYFL